MVDAVTKRQLVLALFVLLQAFKLFEWLVGLPRTIASAPESIDALLGFFFKWTMLELGFMVGLYWARIPRLTWRMETRALVYGMLAGMNLLLVLFAPVLLPSDHGGPAQGDPLPAGLLVDDVVGSRELIRETAGNIAGEFTVKVRPWASVRVNPEGLHFCLVASTPPPHSQALGESTKRPVISDKPAVAQIPLVLSGSGPWTVAYEYASTMTSKGDFFTEQRMSQVFLAEYALLDADRVGYYRVTGVVDGNGTPGRIPGASLAPVFVPGCPEARIDGIAIMAGIDVCVRQRCKQPLKVWLSGTAPFDLVLTRFSGQSSRPMAIAGLTPPAKLLEGVTKHGKFTLFSLDLVDFETAGDHLLRVESIRDGRGLEKRYGEWDVGDSVLVHAYEAPSVAFSRDAQRPPFLLRHAASTPITAVLKGRKPFTVEYAVYDLDDPTRLLATEVLDCATDTLVISAKAAGTYRLLSVKDSLCHGAVALPEEQAVRMVEPPAATVSFTPLKSPCSGDIGGLFELGLTGTGPWRVEVEESAVRPAGRPTKRVLTSTLPKLSHKWIPEDPGVYRIRFTAIADAYYTDLLALDGKPHELTILPMPDARLEGPAPDASGHVHTCLGSAEATRAQIRLSGMGPWRLEALLEQPGGKAESLVWDHQEAVLSYQFPGFAAAGRHSLKLRSVTDANGCSKSLDGCLQVNVLPVLPSASFVEGRSEVRARQGAPTALPLLLKGNKGPWTVTVRQTILGEAVVEEMETDRPELSVSKAGVYEIVGVRDQYCAGHVAEPRTASVAFIQLPRVAFAAANATTSCRCAPSPVDPVGVAVQGGTGLVTVRYHEQFGYDLKDAEAKKPAERHVTVMAAAREGGSATAGIPAGENRLPGFYRYQLVSVSDDVYSDVDLPPGPSFTLQVLPDPTPRIATEAPLLHCWHTSRKDFRLRVEFSGSAITDSGPWDVTYELTHDQAQTPPVAKTATVAGSPGLLHVEALEIPGNYHLKITKAVDAHGCRWQESPGASMEQAVFSGQAVPIHVIETPTITSLDAQDYYCMGDVARFQLGGTGPWTVAYTLTRADGSELHKTDTTKAPSLTILLAEPGYLRIKSVSNAKCHLRDAPALPRPTSVKRLPSAIIEDGSQWIHEEETASFRVRLGGEAPFTFTYQRLDERSKLVMEARTVEGVLADEYVVEVPSVSGTFRIESVRDKYCRYPRLP